MLAEDQIRELDRIMRRGRYRPVDYWYDEGRMALACYQGKGLRIRMRNEPAGVGGGFGIDVAEAATFDRWANSTNFRITVPPRRLLFALWQARCVIKRGVYDFNTYFDTINLDSYAS